ncbi:MAG: hypothetical protein K2O16_03235 [Lachnospiraceae bacterium]|nr:hypothetical protein [Lachnospiraceae bacterium]
METVKGEVINIKEYGSYQEYKAAVDSEMQKSAESFVRIGYLLKLARDTDILAGTPYGSVNEFAQAEYGLDRSQVSRFIRINDEYSEGGYSDRLMEKYRGYGYAKLALMLLLPEAITEEISADYSKSEIQAIKEEVDREKKITDIEVMLEGQDRQQAAMDSVLDRVVHQMGHDQPELYVRMQKARCEDYPDLYGEPMEPGEYVRKAAGVMSEILAPSGEAVHSVRLKGTGRMMLVIKGADKDIAVVNVRSGEKERFCWAQMLEAVGALAVPEASPEHEREWEILYGEPFPAPVIKKESEKKPQPVPGKQGRVTKAKTGGEEKAGGVKENGAEEKAVPECGTGHGPGMPGSGPEGDGNHPGTHGNEKEAGSVPDDGGGELPGQMQLERDFPEYIPDPGKAPGDPEVAPVQPDTPEHAPGEAHKAYMEKLRDSLEAAYKLAELLSFEEAGKKLDSAAETLEKLSQLPLASGEGGNVQEPA